MRHAKRVVVAPAPSPSAVERAPPAPGPDAPVDRASAAPAPSASASEERARDAPPSSEERASGAAPSSADAATSFEERAVDTPRSMAARALAASARPEARAPASSTPPPPPPPGAAGAPAAERALALALVDLPVDLARASGAGSSRAADGGASPRRGNGSAGEGEQGPASDASDDRPIVVVSASPAKRARRRPPASTATTPRRTSRGLRRVVAASREARALGVREGMTGAQALAIAPTAALHEREPEAEAAALRDLAAWAARTLAPRVAVLEERRALVVDVTGAARVHGGEAAIVARARSDLRALGFDARVALADTPLCALAVASSVSVTGREHDAGPIVPPGEAARALATLPPRALPFQDDVLERLRRLGVGTLADLLALPRADLPARLGEEALLVLDRALGLRPDPIDAVAPAVEVAARVVVDPASGGGTDRLDDLVRALEALARRVAVRLETASLAARSLVLEVAREGARPLRWRGRLAAPVASAIGLGQVLLRRVERIDLSRPVTSLTLRVVETAEVEARQGELFELEPPTRASAERLALLVARLEERIGPRRVLRVGLLPDHRPERAHAALPASLPTEPGVAAARPPPGRRPTQLHAAPRPAGVEVDGAGRPRAIRVEAERRSVIAAVGPERIEVGFWDGDEVRRDYWVVDDDQGCTLWTFVDLTSGGWFVHGAFD